MRVAAVGVPTVCSGEPSRHHGTRDTKLKDDVGRVFEVAASIAEVKPLRGPEILGADGARLAGEGLMWHDGHAVRSRSGRARERAASAMSGAHTVFARRARGRQRGTPVGRRPPLARRRTVVCPRGHVRTVSRDFEAHAPSTCGGGEPTEARDPERRPLSRPVQRRLAPRSPFEPSRGARPVHRQANGPSPAGAQPYCSSSVSLTDAIVPLSTKNASPTQKLQSPIACTPSKSANETPGPAPGFGK